MKLPTSLRGITRTLTGTGSAEPIAPEALADLAASEPVIVVGVGNIRAGSTDSNLPGEQRVASLLTLRDVVADLPREQAIVLHCG